MKLGLIGAKLGHSYSGIIHEIFNDITGYKGSYNLIEIPDKRNLETTIRDLISKGYEGLNVTIPYKSDIMSFADYISPETKKIGASNTMVFKNNSIIEYNTDYFGFMKTLQMKDIDPAGKKWTILGSGGSSKSVEAVLIEMGASEVMVASRNKKGGRYISYNDIPQGFGIVNTTPVGMYPNIDDCVIGDKVFKKYKAAVDIIYNPSETLFLKKANKENLKIANGLLMLVAQAVKSQEIWREKAFDGELINEIFTIMEVKCG